MLEALRQAQRRWLTIHSHRETGSTLSYARTTARWHWWSPRALTSPGMNTRKWRCFAAANAALAQPARGPLSTHRQPRCPSASSPPTFRRWRTRAGARWRSVRPRPLPSPARRARSGPGAAVGFRMSAPRHRHNCPAADCGGRLFAAVAASGLVRCRCAKSGPPGRLAQRMRLARPRLAPLTCIAAPGICHFIQNSDSALSWNITPTGADAPHRPNRAGRLARQPHRLSGW